MGQKLLKHFCLDCTLEMMRALLAGTLNKDQAKPNGISQPQHAPELSSQLRHAPPQQRQAAQAQGLPNTHADFERQVAGLNAAELGEAVQQLRVTHRAELAADKRLKLQVRPCA